jgi:hypothetical protein
VVLYLAREYKSAGVVSRIATTRKKVEGIKRCSLLFDRERRRFLFAKRAFSRFDVLAFVVLLRLFSLSLFCDIFLLCAHQIRLASFGLVKEQKKKRAAAKQRKRERVCWEGGKNSLSSFFLLFVICPTKRRRTQKARLLRVEGEKPKKKTEKEKARQSQTNNKKKRGRERRKRESDCLVFVFIRIIFIIERRSPFGG